jgi:hypothetical protein
MSTTHDERFAEIEKTYFDANNNYAADRAAAPNAVETAKVDNNRNAAYEAYNAALVAALSKNGTSVEQAYVQLKEANKSVKEARQSLEDIVDIIDKAGEATGKAGELVEKAKEL